MKRDNALVHKFRLLGQNDMAEKVGLTEEGNSLLELRSDCAVGAAGSTLELPEDGLIYKRIKRLGQWELEESKFLAGELKKLKQNEIVRTALVDIGANTGLITLQAMNIAKTKNDIHLFEPVPRHASSIKRNLRELEKSNSITIHNLALSDKQGSARIFIEGSNQGNASLFPSVVPYNNQKFVDIKLVNTEDYFSNGKISEYENYVIKSDTQGMDALILSKIPTSIWDKTVCALVEIWAIEEINEIHVFNLLEKWRNFRNLSWLPNSKKKVSLDELASFWLSRTGFYRNLYLRK